METIHQRIILNKELLFVAKRGDETRFAKLLGLGDDHIQQTQVAIGSLNGNDPDMPLAETDELDFFLGVTYTGNSLLHIAACSNFLHVAPKIWNRERSLLSARNKVLDTPLHCAARDGSDEMVSLLLGFAHEMGQDVLKAVLRARNKDGQTALHEAARHNHSDVAHSLITTDPEISSVLDDQGISSLYLATTSGHWQVVQTMLQALNGNIEVSRASYAGPHGQTALHAAVLRSKEMTEELLTWKPLLATVPDDSGSTPLHFAASYDYDKIAQVLLKCDHSLAYLSDSGGSFPIHIAAKMCSFGVIRVMNEYCPDFDELLDAEERNILHIAALEGHLCIVHELVCGTSSIHRKMKNARDNDGNTPLNLALESGHEMIVKRLMQDKEVYINTVNRSGLSPRDQSLIAAFNDTAISPGLQKVNFWLRNSMELLGAYCGSRRWDHLVDDHTTKEDEEKENKKLTTAIQILSFGSVLIATATFAAAFALPGGLRAADQHKGGSPVLAKTYAFKAFLVSDIIAFIYSFHATMILLFRGVTLSKSHVKRTDVCIALKFIITASRCALLAFGLAVYVVSAPVNKIIGSLAIAVAVFCFFDGSVINFNFIRQVILRRGRGKRWRGIKLLFRKKLPDATLVSDLGPGANFSYLYDLICYYIKVSLPFALVVLIPLLDRI